MGYIISYDNIPKAIFYLLEGDYIQSPSCGPYYILFMGGGRAQPWMLSRPEILNIKWL